METYKVGQMHMTISVKKDVVGLDISMDNVLAVNIS